MMAQYIEIKAAYPDALLFYRMGDFYELFFGDAETASRVLGITLTKRGKHLGSDIPMCGVPVHSADDYLHKLIKLGHRVAVCEQTEDPQEAKKRGSKSVVRRDVVRLVTPGTITEDNLLEPKSANILATLARVKGGETGEEYAIAAVDISTGQFRLLRSSFTQLMADLSRLQPREIVVSQTLADEAELAMMFSHSDCVVQPQPSTLFESTHAERTICKFFGVATLDGFGTFSRAELAATNAVIEYIQKTQLGHLPQLSRPERDDGRGMLYIDAATRANLELVRTLSGQSKGSLLNTIDRTVSGSGGRLLAERLMNPLTDVATIAARHDDVGYWFSNPAARSQLRKQLKGLSDMARALSRIALERAGPRDLASIRTGLMAAHTIHETLTKNGQGFSAQIEEELNQLSEAPSSLIELLGRALDDELPLLARHGGFIRAGFDAELDRLLELGSESRKVIAGLQARYSEETGVRNLKIKHNNILGYFIEVTALNADPLQADTERFIHRQTMANAMRFTTTELADLESQIANAAGQALQLELQHFQSLIDAINQQAMLIRLIAQMLARLDVSSSLAELAEEQGYCRPLVDDSLSFEIVGGRHAVVEPALRLEAAHPFVANDCRLSGENAGRLWLLTGPNMGGKSTFLRQNALIVLLAQMGSYVPAGKAHLGVVDRLFSRVGAADDLARGRSTFMVEMVETAAILNQASPRSMVILDEIGRGTATFDGLSIAWAAIEHLHEINKSRTLFATHYHELTALTAKLDRMNNVTMAVKEWDGDVVFLHEVIEGSADRSYGIQVAKLAGLPDAVVQRARQVLDQLESQNRERSGDTLIDDLPLFSVAAPKAAQPASSPVLDELAKLQPDELTPKEALEALYSLKSKLD